MKKMNMRILSAFLCFAMLLGTVGNTPLFAYATEVDAVEEISLQPETYAEAADTTISENDVSQENFPESVPEAEIPAPDTATVSGNDTETITFSFYDSDGTTLLYRASTPAIDAGAYVNSLIDNIYYIDISRKGYSIKQWYCTTNDITYTPEKLLSRPLKRSLNFTAVWETTPDEYSLTFNLNGGSFPDTVTDIPSSFNVKSETIVFPTPVRAKYTFGGWFKDAALKQPIDKIAKGTYMDSDLGGHKDNFAVYAKWNPIDVKKVSKPTVKNSAKGKAKITYSSVEGVEGYEIVYSTSKKFKKNKQTKDAGKKTTVTLTNLPKGKTYYVKVRAYKLDSTGKKTYGKYSSVASCKIKKGVKEYTAKSNSGSLKKVNVKGNTDLYVQAKVPKRLKSSDDYYYLVKVDPNTGKVLKQIAKTDKTTTVKFQLPLKDSKGNNHIQGKYGVAVKKGKKYMLITKTSFISNPEAAASYTAAFPKPASKKGRQGRYITSLGDKNYFENFNLNTIIGTKSQHNVKYKYNGKTYYFFYPNLGNVALANKDGGTVTIQVMLQYANPSKDLILKSGRTPGANYYAFNTDEKASREKIEAAFHFLAEYASREDYHVDNWILGNEVNTYANMNAKWYYAGNISRDKFIKNYASTFRMLYYAVKSNNKNARVYICCDHTWINRENDWGTKYFTKAFNDEIKRQNKKIKWNLAYHAYSAVLTNADFWNDGSLAPSNANADFVSPKNLEILTKYVKDNFGKDTRIILSEQGFSCSGGVGSPYNSGRQAGEDVQAAAVAWLYYKAQFNDMIDAVIFSSGDHGGAGYQFDFIGRKAENVYKYMDTPKYATYTNDYLRVINKSSWKNAVKGFNEKTLKAMPNR